MKKKGFTLIELLAVIVILAIIALIATPIVMNVIEKSKKGAAERSAENYISAVETAVATARLNNEILEGDYTINSDGNLCKGTSSTCSGDDELVVDISGNKPSAGSIKIVNGLVDKTTVSLTIGDYKVGYDSEGKIKATKLGQILCTASKTITNQFNVSYVTPGMGNILGKPVGSDVGYLAKDKGAYTPGVEYKCNLGDTNETKNLVFYVLEDKGTEVSLIMDRNLGNKVAWCKNSTLNDCNADGAKEHLANNTNAWSKLNRGQISLPSYEQISSIEYAERSWIIQNLAQHQPAYGYWTSSKGTTDVLAYYVSYNGDVSVDSVQNYYYYGVRPVITISKAQMK